MDGECSVVQLAARRMALQVVVVEAGHRAFAGDHAAHGVHEVVGDVAHYGVFGVDDDAARVFAAVGQRDGYHAEPVAGGEVLVEEARVGGQADHAVAGFRAGFGPYADADPYLPEG